jgi:Holliday junction DNA helicase RuvA
MISRIEGQLLTVQDGRAELSRSGICYEILLPAHDEQRLATMVGENVEFHTLHYYEGQGQGTSFVPRLIGFSTREDRSFFELFTTVKGLGNRKALRALQLPFGAVAEAIAGNDVDLLVSLPEIGRRTAQTIVAELHGKVDRFVEVKPDTTDGGPLPDGTDLIVRDASAVLVQLGEPKQQARKLVERAARAEPTLDSAEELVAAAFRLRDD